MFYSISFYCSKFVVTNVVTPTEELRGNINLGPQGPKKRICVAECLGGSFWGGVSE